MKRVGLSVSVGLFTLLSACAPDDLGSPRLDELPFEVPPPSRTLLDASVTPPAGTDVVPGFYFLPPVVSSPSYDGVFDPSREDEMAFGICRLPQTVVNGEPFPGLQFDGFAGCEIAGLTPDSPDASDGNDIVWKKYDGANDVTAGVDHYSFKFQEPEAKMVPNRFYRMFTLLEVGSTSHILGWVDMLPTEPNLVPSTVFTQSHVYVYKSGSSIPFKVRLELGSVCSLSPGVIECDENIIDCSDSSAQSVATSTSKVVVEGTDCPPNVSTIRITLEELDQQQIQCLTNAQGIPYKWGVPITGDCISVETDLPPNTPLAGPALICIDIDEASFPGDGAQIVKVNALGEIVAVKNVVVPAGVCDDVLTDTALLDVDSGNSLFKMASRGLSSVRRFIGPQALMALDLGEGGEIFLFSEFRWILPGTITPVGTSSFTAMDGATVNPMAVIEDYVPNAMPGATVSFRFPTAAEYGSTYPFADAIACPSGVGGVPAGGPILGTSYCDVIGTNEIDFVTGADGVATVDWTLNGVALGPQHQLIAEGLGFLEELDGSTHHTEYEIEGPGSISFFATATGPASGGSQSPENTDPPQEVEAGTVFGQPLIVTVTDNAGNPLSGEDVEWTVTGGGVIGVLPAGSTVCAEEDFSEAPSLVFTSDGSGQVAACWQVGTTAGPQTVTGILEDGQGNTVGTFAFTVEVTPGPAAALVRLAPASGDLGTAGPGATVGPLTVKIQDEFGNGVESEVPTWSTAAGSNGSLVEYDGAACTSTPLTSASTDSNGESSVCWVLPALIGTYGASASAVDGSANPLSGSPALFTVNATCDGLWGVGSDFAGGGAGAAWACANKTPALGTPGALQVNLGSGGTTAQLLWMNDADNLYLALRIATSSLNRVRFDFNEAPMFNADGTPALDANEDGIGLNPFGGDAFLDQYLSSKCLNSSQTWCPSNDQVSNGWGSSSVAGGQVVYKFSHPLTGGGAQDFDLTIGEAVGFFFTLSNQNGNGAKANTQVPSYRGFNCITIADPSGGNVQAGWLPCTNP